MFRDLMNEKLPRLHAHLEQHKVDYTLITFNWFLVVFVDSVVSDVLFKIWDSFLYEGPKVGLRPWAVGRVPTGCVCSGAGCLQGVWAIRQVPVWCVGSGAGAFGAGGQWVGCSWGMGTEGEVPAGNVGNGAAEWPLTWTRAIPVASVPPEAA